MYNKFPKSSGIYHIKDNIAQLQFQVYFRHVNSLLKLPKYDYNKNLVTEWAALTASYSTELDASTDTTDDVKVTRIKWQQKLLSPSEVELYKEQSNCHTDAQKRYHQWLLEGKTAAEDEGDGGSSGGVTAGRKAKAKRHSKRAKRRQEALQQDARRVNEIFTYVHEDNFVPAEEQQLGVRAQSSDDSVVVMYVYAALSPDTQIIMLKWHPEPGLLHIYPDFNGFEHNPYFIEIDSDYRHLYAYAVENCSKMRQTEVFAAAIANYLQLPEVPTHWNTEKELAAQFAMPPKRSTRVALLFEICEAWHFNYANIHVRYHVQLPRNTILEEGLLHACTHSSTAASGGRTSGHSQFGYNWQLTLLCEEDFNAADLLHIYFELISVDSWSCERVEGYAHYATYLTVGSDSLRLQCLRPADGFLAGLQRFFIGGRQKFDFVGFFTSDASEAELHSRYRCRMRSTGHLRITCQRFSQRNCELLQPCKSRTSGMTLDDIMMAYRAARKRLEAVSLQ